MSRKRKLPEGLVQRGRRYYADFSHEGQRIRKKLATDLEAATKMLRVLRGRLEGSDYGLLDDDVKLSEVEAEYLAYCRQQLKPATVARYQNSLDAALPRLGAVKVSQVTTATILAFRQERLASGLSPRTVNHDVTILKAMLNWARDAKLIGGKNELKLKKLPHDNPKEGRALTHDEVNRLLEASPPWLRDVWYAYLTTGMRKNELASLTFADVDRDNREIIVRMGSSKTHRERRIPIDSGLWKIIEKQRAGRADRRPGIGKTPLLTSQTQERFTREHVFVTPQCTPLTHRSGVYDHFLRCCKKAGIETRTVDAAGREIHHVDVHSLRRTFATDLIGSGADPKSVQELLGHKTLAMTMNLYAKLHSQTKRQALGKLSYGSGVQARDGVLEFPTAAKAGTDCHRSVTSLENREAVAT